MTQPPEVQQQQQQDHGDEVNEEEEKRSAMYARLYNTSTASTQAKKRNIATNPLLVSTTTTTTTTSSSTKKKAPPPAVKQITQQDTRIKLKDMFLHEENDDVVDATVVMQLFDDADVNKNGYLSLAEVDKLLVTVRHFSNWNSTISKPALMRAYQSADDNENGYISRQEWPYLYKYIQLYHELYMAFYESDIDNDGRITLDELIAVAPKLGLKDAKAIFMEMDTNQGGLVLFDEFCAWMIQHRSRYEWKVKKHIKVNNTNTTTRRRTKKKQQKKSSFVPKLPNGIETDLPFPSTKEGFDALWNDLDVNGNLMLSLAELDKGIVTMLHGTTTTTIAKPVLLRAYKYCDVNDDGFVKKSEFRSFFSFVEYFHYLWTLFEKVQTDDDYSDRRISSKETQEHWQKLKPLLSTKSTNSIITNAQELFQAMDSDDGGYVLFAEFCSFMVQQQEEESSSSLL